MKKLLLLAGALLFAASCSDPNQKPEPVKPVGDPTINITKIDQKALADTTHLIIGNYEGEVEITCEDENFALSADPEQVEGVIVLSSFTYGATKIYVKCGDVKTFTIEANYKQFVTEKFYTEPLMVFGKTVEEVKALEAERGNIFKETSVKDGNAFVKFTVKTPNKFATSGEEFHYVFKVTGTDTYGPCQQSTIYSYYGKATDAEDIAFMAWASTTESWYYGGEDDNDNSLALSRDLKILTVYGSGKYTDGSFGYTGHYVLYSPKKADVKPFVLNEGFATTIDHK